MPRSQTWNDEFRPQKIEDCILPVRVKIPLAELADSGVVQPLVLVGPPGSGKTTVARILGQHPGTVFKTPDLFDRFFGKLEEAVDMTFRDDIREAKSKVVLGFIDDAQLLPPKAQSKLSWWIENEHSSVVFMLATLDKSRLMPELRSRLMVFDLSPTVFEYRELMAQALTRCREIVRKARGVLPDDSLLSSVVEAKFPDYRAMINELYKACVLQSDSIL